MFSKLCVLTSMILFCLAQAASAGDADLSKEYSACMDKSGGVTVSMIECISAETDRQDAYLNNMYKKVMASLSPERKKALKKAQRAWIKYRDANCSFYYDPDGGTLARVEAASCLMTETAERAKELGSFLEEN